MNWMRLAYWIAVGAVSIMGLQYTTLADQYYANFAICVAFVLLVLMACLFQNRNVSGSASEAELGSLNALYMALIWTWGTVALALLYTTVISWKEWWQFVLGFGAAAVASFFFAYLLRSKPDGMFLGLANVKVARITAWVQLVAMVVTMLGLIIDNKMDKLGWNFAERGNPPNDWAANNVFWVGAAGLALISIISLRYGDVARYRDDD